MSSKPSPEGVADTIKLIDEIQRLDVEIADLAAKTRRLASAREERAQLDSQLAEHMRSMDVHEPGNWGWTGRFGWFAAELLRQARSK